MPLSTSLNALFVHVPKTGGTSIEKALGVFGDWRIEDRARLFGQISSDDLLSKGFGSAFLQHLTYSEILRIVDQDTLREAFSFAFVRNPWDRLVSVFSNPDPHMVESARTQGIVLTGMPFASFVRNALDFRHVHLLPQTLFVCDDKGQLKVDFVGRFEQLQQDFASVARRIGVDVELPHANASTHSDYRSYYDAETRRLIADLYQDDIEFFGYRFD
jgi:hypothetical protein